MHRSAGRYGVTFPLPGRRLADHEDWVRRLPDLGYTDLWTGESVLTDAFAALAAANAWAPQLRLGTGIVPAFTRAPGLLAMSAATLADLAPGRFVLGVGASSPAVVQRWGGVPFERPYARTRDVVRFLRSALAGEKVTASYETFTVDGFRLGLPPAQPPPVLTAGLRPRMLTMAGRESDGAVLTWVSPDDVRRMAPYVRAGGDGKQLVAWVTVCPSTDAEAVRAQARSMVTGYLTVPAYAEFQRWCGRGEQLAPMWAAWERGDRAGALAAVPDALVDELVVHGPVEYCRERIAEYHAAGVDTVAYAFLPGVADPETATALLAPR